MSTGEGNLAAAASQSNIGNNGQQIAGVISNQSTQPQQVRVASVGSVDSKYGQIIAPIQGTQFITQSQLELQHMQQNGQIQMPVSPRAQMPEEILQTNYSNGSGCCLPKTQYSLVDKELHITSTSPDLCCCCITEDVTSVDLNSIFKINRYKPSCCRTCYNCICLLPCCWPFCILSLFLPICPPIQGGTAGVTLSYGPGRTQDDVFIRTNNPNSVETAIKYRKNH